MPWGILASLLLLSQALAQVPSCTEECQGEADPDPVCACGHDFPNKCFALCNGFLEEEINSGTCRDIACAFDPCKYDHPGGVCQSVWKHTSQNQCAGPDYVCQLPNLLCPAIREPVCLDSTPLEFANPCFAARNGFQSWDYTMGECAGVGVKDAVLVALDAGVLEEEDTCGCSFEFEPVCLRTPHTQVTFMNECMLDCKEGTNHGLYWPKDDYAVIPGECVDPCSQADACPGGFACLPFNNQARCVPYDATACVQSCEKTTNPVCVIGSAGGDVVVKKLELQTPCAAECQGFSETDYVLGPCEVDRCAAQCANATGPPVCVPAAALTLNNSCVAACVGYSYEQYEYGACTPVDDGGAGGAHSGCECAPVSPEQSVCTWDCSRGVKEPFPSACLAACANRTLVVERSCEGVSHQDFGDVLEVCEVEGVSPWWPTGNYPELSLCQAKCACAMDWEYCCRGSENDFDDTCFQQGLQKCPMCASATNPSDSPLEDGDADNPAAEKGDWWGAVEIDTCQGECACAKDPEYCCEGASWDKFCTKTAKKCEPCAPSGESGNSSVSSGDGEVVSTWYADSVDSCQAQCACAKDPHWCCQDSKSKWGHEWDGECTKLAAPCAACSASTSGVGATNTQDDEGRDFVIPPKAVQAGVEVCQAKCACKKDPEYCCDSSKWDSACTKTALKCDKCTTGSSASDQAGAAVEVQASTSKWPPKGVTLCRAECACALKPANGQYCCKDSPFAFDSLCKIDAKSEKCGQKCG